MTVKIRQDPQGRWWIRIDWHQRRASRLMPSQERAIEVAKKIADALDLYGERALEMIRRPAPVTKAKLVPTFGEYAETWLRNLHHVNLKQTTRTVYGWAMHSHLIPAFKDVPLTDIGYTEMKAFVLSKKAKYSRDSIQQMVGPCRVMFNEAIREGLIERNPCTHLGQFYARTKRDSAIPRSDVYTLQELYAIEDMLFSKRSLFDTDDGEMICKNCQAISSRYGRPPINSASEIVDSENSFRPASSDRIGPTETAGYFFAATRSSDGSSHAAEQLRKMPM